MTRAKRVALCTTIFSSFYLLVYFQFIILPFIDEKVSQQILSVIPWWLLVSFGSYSLWCLGRGLYTFRDTPEAYHELLGEITEAKNDLRKLGVTVD